MLILYFIITNIGTVIMTRKSLEIANTLEREILTGAFKSGELIDEMAIAKRFDASRTPVREALLNLSATGLVELERGRGAVVVGISLDRIFETYEVLAELMGFAAALTAKRMTPLNLAHLQALHEEMRQHTGKEQRDEYKRLDGLFHESVLQGCANKVLIRQVVECERTISAVRRASIEAHESLEAMYAEHERIVNAIRNGDAEGARNAMRDHVQLRSGGASKLISSWRQRNPELVNYE